MKYERCLKETRKEVGGDTKGLTQYVCPLYDKLRSVSFLYVKLH